MNRSIELLAPARDLECGITAIDCGADAVYVGAPQFGAREAVGNTLEDIAALASHAHKFWARVYVALNTILRDDEVPAARRMAWQLHESGADGLIIQDTALLRGEMPPLPLIASTQMHNHTPERVAFLEKIGIRRVILARELDLEQIRAIRRAAPRIELEFFVHGALCVSFSGQCYLSYALGGRSGNRGKCAQPCRREYMLVDASGQVLEYGGHALSLKDLNLSEHLPELVEAGIDSFKIEGRLKDKTYVANVVAHYNARLVGYSRTSSGVSSIGFTPDPSKTFNRGFTTYFLHGRGAAVASPETPKMTGETVGRVGKVERRSFTVDTTLALHAGDGICFFDSEGQLCGTVVNGVNGKTITPAKMDDIAPGMMIHRNHDHEFLTRLGSARKERRIRVSLTLHSDSLVAEDEDGNRANAVFPGSFTPAEQPGRATDTILRQLARTGDTEFACQSVKIAAHPVPFIPISVLNGLRRDVLSRLREERSANRPIQAATVLVQDAAYPETELSFTGNVLNREAEAFYREHGVIQIEPAAESGLDLLGRRVMTARYCLKHELGSCPRKPGARRFEEPLALIDEEGNRLELHFDCRQCVMEIYLETR